MLATDLDGDSFWLRERPSMELGMARVEASVVLNVVCENNFSPTGFAGFGDAAGSLL
jgi:hypothetical protein